MVSRRIALTRRPQQLHAPGHDRDFFPFPSGVQHPNDFQETDEYGNDYANTNEYGSNNQPINSYDKDYQTAFIEMQHQLEPVNRNKTALANNDESNPQPEHNTTAVDTPMIEPPGNACKSHGGFVTTKHTCFRRWIDNNI